MSQLSWTRQRGSSDPAATVRASPGRQAFRSTTSQQAPRPAAATGHQAGRLLVTGIALSIDNLAVGFALGAYHVNLAIAAIMIGAVSITLSLLGLELGARLGAKAGERGEILGGIVLIGAGIAIATGTL